MNRGEQKQFEEMKSLMTRAVEEKWKLQEMFSESQATVNRLKRKLRMSAVAFKVLGEAFKQVEMWDESDESTNLSREAQSFIKGILKKMKRRASGEVDEREERNSNQENK